MRRSSEIRINFFDQCFSVRPGLAFPIRIADPDSMFKKINFIFLFFFGLSVSAYSDSFSNPVVNSHPGPGKIIVIGDSIAYGTGAMDSVNTPTGCLQSQFPNLSVSNLAVPGATTKDTLKKLPVLLKNSPTLVFISTGGNDVLRNFYLPGSYPAQNSLQEFENIVSEFQKAGALVAYLKINPPFDVSTEKRLVPMADQAQASGAVIVDGMDGLWGTDKMFDLLHPNDNGYEIVCQRILEAVTLHYP